MSDEPRQVPPVGLKIGQPGETPVSAMLDDNGLRLWNPGHDDHAVTIGTDSLDQLIAGLARAQAIRSAHIPGAHR